MTLADPVIRKPAVAGKFYPDNPTALALAVDSFVGQATCRPVPAKAIAVPHAGYLYSGPIAGNGYAMVRHLETRIKRVVVLGPAHRHSFAGLAVPSADAFATPLGPIAVDRDMVGKALGLDGVRLLDAAFDGEHAIEVQLPFIQRLFPDAVVVPVVVGDARPGEVERVLEALWGGPETLIVISTDLSHYHDDATARRQDTATAHAIESADDGQITARDACGATALAGLMRRARAIDLRITTRDLRHSGDTAGDPTRVVGYGAFSFEAAEDARLEPAEQTALLTAAREALTYVVEKGKTPAVAVDGFSWPLKAIRRTFVTITIDGALRGCIGSVVAHRPLIEDVVANTGRSAIGDPRFPRMTADEAARAQLSIAILSHDRPLTITSPDDLIAQLRPGQDGLILRDGARSALFLPKVWEILPEPENFVSHLKQKAGLPADHFSPNLTAIRFVAENFTEPAPC